MPITGNSRGCQYLTESVGKFPRRDALVLEAVEDPRQEDEVAEPGLDGRCAWAEHHREGVPRRVQTQHVEGRGLFERTEQNVYSLACGFMEGTVIY